MKPERVVEPVTELAPFQFARACFVVDVRVSTPQLED